ncbi:MAG: ATP-binding protein [Planctomycetota bacterium]
MLQSRLLWKLYAGYVVLILLATTILGLLVGRQIEQGTLDEIRDSLRARAALLCGAAAPSLGDRSDATLQARVRQLGSEIHTRLTVIRPDGRVLADSEEDPSRMDDHSNRPEILAAGSEGFGTAIRFSNTVGTRMMYVALPVRSTERLLGTVRASFPLSAIDERLAHLWAVVTLGAGVAALAALILGFFMARGFAAPLASMTEVAESMSRGDYGQELPVTGKDELGKLAMALNRMARSSRERMETITTEHNKLLAILAGMVEGVVAVDDEERVLHLNRVAASILRAAPEPRIGRKVWEVSRVPELCEALARTLENGTETRRELRLVGHPRDRLVEMHAAPLRNSEGQLAGAVAVLHDVTQLERLERIRRDFVGNVSHELKTPITAIRGLIETLLDDRAMDPGRRERFLARIAEQSLRLSSLVTDLLALSRLESEDSALERASLDLRAPVEAAAQALLPAAEERGIRVEVRTPDTPLGVRGDAEALRQVATNLLDNALKYSSRGGRVWLRLVEDGGQAVLEVEDSGIGIERRHRERIFERFYRVDKARSRELGGTGLGLSIVKHLVLAHRGDVSVESEPGKGSCFRVRIPLASGFTG